MGRGNQYIQFVKVLYLKLLTIGKQVPASLLEVGPGIRTPISAVGGESVTTLPPCLLENQYKRSVHLKSLTILADGHAQAIDQSKQSTRVRINIPNFLNISRLFQCLFIVVTYFFCI